MPKKPDAPAAPDHMPARKPGAPALLSPKGSAGEIATAALIIIAIGGLAWLAVELARFFLLIFAAIVIAAVFDAIASWLSRRTGMPRPLGLALAVIGMFAMFGGAFLLFGSQIASEFDTIRATVPRSMESIEQFLDRYGMGDRARELVETGSQDISRILSSAGGFALAAGSGIADAVLVLVGAIFLAADPATYRRGLLLLVPARAEPTAGLALDDSGKGLRGWMMGQAVSSLVVGALTWLGLELLGVPAAGGLAVVAGLLDVIPMIGPVIAGLPAALLAFTVSPVTALWTVLLFLGIQQLQGNFLQPMIQKQAVNVPPAVLLFAVLAAGLLFGFIGVLLAAPLTIVVFVMVQRVYVEGLLGKPVEVGGGG
ncbi:AI-2E family transporter [Parasphingorhabdus sp.]|uniref:AI-2E family transporter n=1 Tax=Parasphingorhabdus sp. TaxID=2709688 RepID=UPI003002C504